MVELTYLAIIGIGLAAMFFGYGFGLFEGRSQGYKKRKKDELQENANQPPPKPEVVTETKTVNVDDPGLLRIKNEGGSFTLDLDGARVNPAFLASEQRKRLIEIISIMRPWLEGRPAPAPSTTAAPPPSFQPTRSASIIGSPPAGVTQEKPVPAAPSANPKPSAAKPGTPTKEDRPSAPANSIVAQIDSILQTRLIGTPLEGRGIYVTESPQGGVSVFVGLTRYNGIDEVPDPEIKAAIRAATQEWEKKYTPGL